MGLKALVEILDSSIFIGSNMKFLGAWVFAGMAFVVLFSGCSGGASDAGAGATDSLTPASGSISISITDGPREDVRALVLNITGMDLGHSNGDIIRLDLSAGPMSIDMMQLQNGVFEPLIMGMEVPLGQYDWMRLHVDLSQSYVDLAGTGGRHSMQMGSGAANGLEVHEPFEVLESMHQEFMLDFDLRRGVQHHHIGMMGDQYELHSAMRLVHMDGAGGLTGMVDASMVDVYHPDCDPAPGGNWVYLFPGDAVDPDDVAEPESDGLPGPMATDRVEMDPGSGDHFYHFGYLPAGSYRIAVTCSGEWDEAGDDDYPSGPDGRFNFQMFSDPLDVVAGQMHRFDMMP
jgi:hypothetical protein